MPDREPGRERTIVSDDAGATRIEYALLIGLIAVACIGAIGALSGAIQQVFTASPTPFN